MASSLFKPLHPTLHTPHPTTILPRSTCPHHCNPLHCSTETMSSNPRLSHNPHPESPSCSLMPHIHLSTHLHPPKCHPMLPSLSTFSEITQSDQNVCTILTPNAASWAVLYCQLCVHCVNNDWALSMDNSGKLYTANSYLCKAFCHWPSTNTILYKYYALLKYNKIHLTYHIPGCPSHSVDLSHAPSLFHAGMLSVKLCLRHYGYGTTNSVFQIQFQSDSASP